MGSIFIDTLQGKETSRPPVWMMRQAGRVLPNYQKLRETYSFQQLMTIPELAAEVTLMPVTDLGVDAAILFSDILVIPQALGLEVAFPDSGPVFSNPFCKQGNIPALNFDPQRLSYVYDAIDCINARKESGFPLIGFCGGPLTTYLFMAQGTSANHLFNEAIMMFYNNSAQVLKVLEQITDASIEYATQQCQHGVAAFQIFETYAGLLPTDVYLSVVYPFVEKLLRALEKTGVPVIFFPRGLGTGLAHLSGCSASFISIDWQVSLADARKLLGNQTGLQGNLDPRLLATSNRAMLDSAIDTIIDFWKTDKKLIFNLGHGITPHCTLENTRHAIDRAKRGGA
jgi:uroporphyrinogen decarboxylase